MATWTVVTGGSAGLGLAFVEDALGRGDRVMDVSRSGPPERLAPDVEHLRLDLADPASWPALADRVATGAVTLAEGDRVLVLHAAGVIEPIGMAGEVDADAYVTATLLDVAAPVALGGLLVGALAPREDLRRQICQVSSGAATSTYEGWSAYCAGKAAMEHWTRVVGQEQQRRGGVEVSAVAPGVVATGMQETIRTQDAEDFPPVERFRELHAEGELTAPADAARRLRDLLDDGAGHGAVLDLRDVAG